MISPLGAQTKLCPQNSIPGPASRRFVADAIHARDVATIRDRMAALHCFPG